MVRADIERRRERIRSYTRDTEVATPPATAGGTLSRTVSVESFRGLVRPKNTLFRLALVGLVGALVVAGAFFMMRRSPKPETPAQAELSAAPASAPRPDTPSPVQPVESQREPIPAPPASSVTAPVRAPAAPRPARKSAKEPKFSNPYGK
jgi:hypothetical protein